MKRQCQGRQRYIYGSAVTKTKPNLVLVKNQKKKRNNAKSILTKIFISIEVVIFIAISICIAMSYLTIKTKAIQTREEIMQLESELSSLKRENDDDFARIKSNIDLEKIREKAIALGMYYPDETQVIYFENIDDDYVRQINSIP